MRTDGVSWRFFVGFLLGAVLTLAAFQAVAQIPADAHRWRSELVRNARLAWGLDAPVSTFAAQIHQESGWRAGATSAAGAAGMAQFLPATADWLAGVYAHVGPADPSNPVWALRAMTVYDRHLWDRVSAVDRCHRGAKMLSAYNGGHGWLMRDEALAKARGLDPARWFGSVERVNSGRSAANWRENRGYPRRILHELEPRYAAAGWGAALCR
jgi:soluble lytic murein transglycosylase-like protein